MNKKFIYLKINVRDGQREYTIPSAHEAPDETDVNAFADGYASEFYPWDEAEEREGEEGYFFYDGEVHVTVSHAVEITKDEYETLNRFLGAHSELGILK